MSFYDSLDLAEKAKYKSTVSTLQDLYDGFKSQIFGDPNYDSYVFSIDHLYFYGSCEINGVYEHEVDIKDCIFRNKCDFRNCEFKDILTINHCQFDQDLWIYDDSKFEGRFNLIEIILTSYRQIYVEGGSFNICWWSIIGDCSVKISGGNFDELNLGTWGDGCKLKYLSFDFRKAIGLIRIANSKSKIKSVVFHHFNGSTTLEIDSIMVNNIRFYKYRNEKSLRILDLQTYHSDSQTELSMEESYFGKAEFYSIDFTLFEIFNIYNSYLIECNFVNVKWNYNISSFKGRGQSKKSSELELASNIRIIEEDLIENSDRISNLKQMPEVLEYYSRVRENFRQLKFALGKQGDVINEQKFHIKEMLAYDNTITIESDPWTKLIIYLSSKLSDFGQSISKPIVWLFVGHLILYVILIIVSGQINHVIRHIDNTLVEVTTNRPITEIIIYNYLFLMNPLRKAESTLPGSYIIFDFMMRIWASYMIYNFVRATRRFIK